MKDDLLNKEQLMEDEDQTLRPQKLNDFTGQKDLIEMLDVYIKAALLRNEALDHILFYGPPGLGKTTLAQIIANELESNIKTTSGPAIEKAGDLAAILSSLNPGDVLFIDEIHRMPKFVEEILYAAMEDYVLDIIIGKDSESRAIRIDLPPFTLVGATTRFGDLTAPLRDRFGVVFKMNYYEVNDLEKILNRTSHVYETKIEIDACSNLARRSRGTPRIANRLFRRVRDYAQILGDGVITDDITNLALGKLGVNQEGLNDADLVYLKSLIFNFNGGPVGLDSLATSIAEETTTIEDVYEPYLIQEGYIQRTSRGRVALKKAYDILKTNKNEGFI